jgi:hypothetical protein
VDLLLCGHHYRVSQAALRAAGAVVYDEFGLLITDRDAGCPAASRPPAAAASRSQGLGVGRAYPVVHTSHPTYRYLIEADSRRAVCAPEFLEFPAWAARADLMFAESAGWARPIRFAKGAGGHASALAVAEQAVRHGVRRLVFARIGRPAIATLDAGLVPPFGEIGEERGRHTLGSP